MHTVYTNHCHTFLVFFCETETKFKCSASSMCLASACVCTILHSCTHIQETHTWLSTVCVCVCDPSGLVWFFPIERLMNGEQEGSTATRTHGNSPLTLSATTPFVRHIYLCVRRVGKSLTRRPSELLNATDQRESERDYVCALSIICAFSTLSINVL